MTKNGKNFGEGIRRLYKDALDETRAMYPRYKETRDGNNNIKQSKLRHKTQWYIDGHLANRPLYGIYALGTLAEHLLHKVKFSKHCKSQAIHPVMSFFAETRRVMRDVLTSCSIDKRLPKDTLARMRTRVLLLIESAKIAVEAVNSTKKTCMCPACRGRNLSAYDEELLNSILYERSVAGIIPPDSALFRNSPIDISPQEML